MRVSSSRGWGEATGEWWCTQKYTIMSVNEANCPSLKGEGTGGGGGCHRIGGGY